MSSDKSGPRPKLPIADKYDPKAIEADVYAAWEQGGYFSSQPREDAKDNFCILLPPPNVTGSLHMGHAFQHVVMDALTRHARMQGRNTLWQPGTDHAGVGTHIVVSRALRGQGIDPDKLTREQFLDKVLAWKEESATTIGTQMRRLGDSCDWERECFTLDPALSQVVRDVFIRLYEDGLIYRGKRLVNWDPKLLTALADLEVVSEEEEGVMYHVRYPFVDGAEGDGMVIATTRPETILVDGALAVAPGDERHAAQIGRYVHVPCTKRTIEIIADEHVDPEFGSGCVKITAAHDFNDYEVAKRHPDKNIPVLELMTPDARLNHNAPKKYQGLDRYEARERIVADLDAQGLLIKKEPHRYMLPRGERSGVVVEPMLSDQWFLKTEDMAKQALEAVDTTDEENKLQFCPESWDKVYRNWIGDVKDWCISRQIDWGHRIPAWQDEAGEVFVATDAKEAQQKAGDDRKLTQVDDVLDTWFSSALWPLSTLGWPDTEDPHFRAYFPTSVLVTGNDIIFFWVARMVMMAKYFTGKVPFRDVYMHGLVRDRNGDKMSKSRGNVLDPIDLIDGIGLDELLAKRVTPDLPAKAAKEIEKRTRKEFPDGIPAFGADALRLTFASLASHGRNINFDLGRIDGHRRLCTKLWQAARFVLLATEDYTLDTEKEVELNFADKWISVKLQQVSKLIDQSRAAYRLDLWAMNITRFLRELFCDVYIEAAKETLETEGTQRTLISVFAEFLKLAHPIIPHITSELWPHFGPKAGFEDCNIIHASFPMYPKANANMEEEQKMNRIVGFCEKFRQHKAEIGLDHNLRINAVFEGELTVLEQKVFVRLARLANLKKGRVSEQDQRDPIIKYSDDGLKIRLYIREHGEANIARLQSIAEACEDYCLKIRGELTPEFIQTAPPKLLASRRKKLERAKQRRNGANDKLNIATANFMEYQKQLGSSK